MKIDVNFPKNNVETVFLNYFGAFDTISAQLKDGKLYAYDSETQEYSKEISLEDFVKALFNTRNDEYSKF